jgi:hypothetical protein
VPETSSIEQLESKLGQKWPHLTQARHFARKRREDLAAELAGSDERPGIGSRDLSVVVFGSLARDELTLGSDPDWTLLINGGADPNHLDVSREVEGIFAKSFNKKPGREGTFGTMAFSHDLVHQIGGQEDTNRNTTRRILLLLESAPIGERHAYDLVIRAVLKRYLLEDNTFERRQAQYHVPRFLLNDFARYWRTMAVDFAYKARTRSGEGKAMRNIKLRMSRKLIYASGLLACFACHLGLARAELPNACQAPSHECVECLRKFMSAPPLEILSRVLLHLGSKAEPTANKIITAYDTFIGTLADEEKRKHLEALQQDEIDNSPVFRDVRKASHAFRDGLLELFFDMDEFKNLTRMYGVF